MTIEPTTWLVVQKRDTAPVEVTPFTDQEEAERFYVDASENWTETYLCRVVHGPGPGWGPRPHHLPKPP